jgi:hypothetical protein
MTDASHFGWGWIYNAGQLICVGLDLYMECVFLKHDLSPAEVNA